MTAVPAPTERIHERHSHEERQPHDVFERQNSCRTTKELAERIRHVFRERSDVRERKVCGGLAFLSAGRMWCGILGGDLIVRIARRRIPGGSHPGDDAQQPLAGCCSNSGATSRRHQRCTRRWRLRAPLGSSHQLVATYTSTPHPRTWRAGSPTTPKRCFGTVCASARSRATRRPRSCCSPHGGI